MQSITTGGDRERKPCTCYRAPCSCYNTVPPLLCTSAVRGRDSLHKREPTTLWVSAFSAIPSHPRSLHDRKFWIQYKTVKSFCQTTFFVQRLHTLWEWFVLLKAPQCCPCFRLVTSAIQKHKLYSLENQTIIKTNYSFVV